MKPERWQQIDKLLEAALEREEGERSAFLKEACAGDESLHKEVESLLAADKQAENLIEAPAVEMVAEGFAADQVGSLEGRQMGSYKILSLLGAGGMGEVYRARDMKLEREVAIKVLPAEFTQDPKRVARFQREAKLLASLNHPNIAAIHGLEESDGLEFLVLELVEGKTLAKRLVKGPMPVEEALEVCRQIAEGVEAAHEKGVIHRDLKPANVKVTPEGKVKILDFGLAKVFEGEIPDTDISQSPTFTEEMTKSGMILGTAAYMSPEQAKGKPVDKRADIFAFGALLYELLTGKRTFEGETITETLGAIIHKEPDWGFLPESTPSIIQVLLRQCLQKDPSARLRDIGDFRALSDATAIKPVQGISPDHQPPWKRAIPWSIAVVVVIVGVSITLWDSEEPVSLPLSTFAINPPSEAPLADFPGLDLVISPDGRRIVYVAQIEGTRRQLYVRPLDGIVATPIEGTQGMGYTPFFSSDGESIAFLDGGKLKKVSLSGGPSTTLCEATSVTGGSWDSEDTIIFAGGTQSGRGLYRVSAGGGEPESLAIIDSENSEVEYRQPEILPGGKVVLFTLHRADGSFQIAALSLETGKKKIVVEGGRDPHYAPTGHLIYEAATTGTLMALPFDLERVEVIGKSAPILEGVRQRACCAADYTVSLDGTLAYIPDPFLYPSRLVWVDREGREVEPLIKASNQYRIPRLSPDGQRLAVGIRGDIWIHDLSLGTRIRLTFGGFNYQPVWTPDGKRVTFVSRRPGPPDLPSLYSGRRRLYWKQADGSGEIELLQEADGFLNPTAWAPDGQTLAFFEASYGSAGPGLHDLRLLQLGGDTSEFVATPFDERSPMFHPDGGWVAYVSNESGRDEVYVQSYPDPRGKLAISTEGGREPMWSRDGRELFYRQGLQMIVVPVTTKPTFTAEEPQLLFAGPYLTSPHISQFDVSNDGKRFVMIRPDEESTSAQIHVVLNWFEELKRLVPTN